MISKRCLKTLKGQLSSHFTFLPQDSGAVTEPNVFYHAQQKVHLDENRMHYITTRSAGRIRKTLFVIFCP